jgi:hypothetical protein
MASGTGHLERIESAAILFTVVRNGEVIDITIPEYLEEYASLSS